jgi:hypothetical protein
MDCALAGAEAHRGRPLNAIVSRHMRAWKPISLGELQKELVRQLAECAPAQLEAWERYRVEPFRVLIMRAGMPEQVFVVAQKDREVMYYEDVEEGFNVSRLTAEGGILAPGHNQDELRVALRRWQ